MTSLGYVACAWGHITENGTYAASGNSSAMTNADECFSLTNAATLVLVYTQCVKEHFQLHLTDPGIGTDVQEQGTHVTDTFTYGGITCLVGSDMHLADGQLQYALAVTTCN
jgi:hypothetical protein